MADEIRKYQSAVDIIKTAILQSPARAAKAVNQEQLALYLSKSSIATDKITNNMNRTIVLFILALISLLMKAETIEVGGVYYKVSDKRCVEVVSSSHKYMGDITIPETIRHNGITYKVVGIGEDAFYECYDLKSISLPNSITYVSKQAFRLCKGLNSISLPDNITEIGERAFLDCDNICFLKLPNKLKIIRDGAFGGCKKIESITLPESLFEICRGAFYHCENVKSLFVPKNVQYIGYRAFRGCCSLQKISVDSLNTQYDSRNDCNAIIESNTNILVTGCMNTIIPTDIVSIGESAFDGCSGLSSIDIPKSVKFIDKGAFTWSGLKSIEIPNGVEEIGEFAFQSCNSMTSVIIPESVIKIDEVAFSGCDSLKAVTILGKDTYIDDEAFASCPQLADVYFHSPSILSVGKDVFEYCSRQAVLHVQPSMLDYYKNSNMWKYTFDDIVAIGSEKGGISTILILSLLVLLLLMLFFNLI